MLQKFGLGAVLVLGLGLQEVRAQVPGLPSSRAEQNIFNVEALQTFDGNVIHQIHIHGVRWTRDKAIRWLLSQHEGDVFVAEKWMAGIHKLYDTSVLYNIVTTVIPAKDPAQSHAIDIELSITDRWSLMPFGIAQAGGGSNNLGGGVFEANAFGYFAQVATSYSVFDHVPSYDFNIYQEFFLDTDYMWGIDISQSGMPVSLQANDRTSLGAFTWEREQDQLLLGHRFTSVWEPKIRFFSFFEYFRDHMVDNSQAPEVWVYNKPQYRLRPTLILGRSELTNFLEQGQEITLSPTSANFFSGKMEYSQMVATYKKVFLYENTNYALFFNGGAMDRAPIPYLFHLGGYDTVRGFSTNRAVGRYYLNDNLEYRPYLTRFRLPLIGEVVIQGDVFSDGGMMWNSSDLAETRRVNSSLFMLSSGVGFRWNLMRFAGAIVRIDVARTITPNEGWGGALGVGQFF